MSQSMIHWTALIVALAGQAFPASAAEGVLDAELIFPLHPQHNHAPGIVECPNGDLLVSWYRGSGERRADDVAPVMARVAPSMAKPLSVLPPVML